jgi:hypothetical protein
MKLPTLACITDVPEYVPVEARKEPVAGHFEQPGLGFD